MCKVCVYFTGGILMSQMGGKDSTSHDFGDTANKEWLLVLGTSGHKTH